MQHDVVSIKRVLDIILKTTKQNANILADSYLIKDPSIISKWKNGKAIPSNEDIMKIVDFTLEKSSDVQRNMMRNEIEALIINSELKNGIKNSLLNISSFKEFLTEALNISTFAGISNSIEDKASHAFGNHRQYETFLTRDRTIRSYDISDTDSIKAVSDNMEGKYTGTVEFNMILSKDKGENFIGTIGNKNINIKSKGNFSLGNKLGNLQMKLKSKSVLGVVLVIFITGYLVTHAANNNQAANDNASVAEINTSAQLDNSMADIPIQSEKPAEAAQKQPETNTNSQAVRNESPSLTTAEKETVPTNEITLEGDSNKPTNAPSNEQSIEPSNEPSSEPVSNNTVNPKEEDKTDTVKSRRDIDAKAKSPKIQTPENPVNNNQNNSANVKTNYGNSIEGDGNSMGVGSNIYINNGN